MQSRAKQINRTWVEVEGGHEQLSVSVWLPLSVTVESTGGSGESSVPSEEDRDKSPRVCAPFGDDIKQRSTHLANKKMLHIYIPQLVNL